MNEKHLEPFSSKKAPEELLKPNLKYVSEQHLEGEEMSFRCRVKRQFSSWK